MKEGWRDEVGLSWLNLKTSLNWNQGETEIWNKSRDQLEAVVESSLTNQSSALSEMAAALQGITVTTSS